MTPEKEKHGKKELKEWQKREKAAARRPRYHGAWTDKKDFTASLDLTRTVTLWLAIIFGVMLIIGLYFADNAPTKIGWTAENTPGIISVTIIVAIFLIISIISRIWMRYEKE